MLDLREQLQNHLGPSGPKPFVQRKPMGCYVSYALCQLGLDHGLLRKLRALSAQVMWSLRKLRALSTKYNKAIAHLGELSLLLDQWEFAEYIGHPLC
jgi:hypothetical protein